MLKKNILRAAALCALVPAMAASVTACRLFEYEKIKGYDTVGIVEKSNDEEDVAAETILISQLPNMHGENGFAKAEILGTSGGKLYVIAAYGSFNYENNSVEKVDGGNMIVEMETSSQIDYNSMDGDEFIRNAGSFVPEDLQRRLPDNTASLSMADYYAMEAGELEMDLMEEARDYFTGD